MNKFLKTFKDRKLKYGTYSVLTALVVIAILILVNAIVSKMNVQFDLSQNSTYTLTQKSKDILGKLQEDVTIYPLFKTGEEDDTFVKMIQLYESQSSHVTVVYKDPYVFPNFTKKYAADAEIPTGSVIVESARRFKIITADELMNYTLNPTTYQYEADSIDVEPKLTSAILFVTMDKIPKVYAVTGHSELTIPQTVLDKISMANFAFAQTELFNLTEMPEDCDILLLQTPGTDYTPEEAAVVTKFLANDGRALFLNDYTSKELPNFNQILSAYGVGLSNMVVVEGDATYSFQNSPTAILPKFVGHDITTALAASNKKVLIPLAQAIQPLDLKKSTLTIDPILQTSEAAYGKKDQDSQSINKEPGDAAGPFDIAVAITDAHFTDVSHTTKLVVVGSESLINGKVEAYVSGANSEFVLACMHWLSDASEGVYIQPKSIETGRLTLSTSDIGTITFVTCGVIPCILFVSGFVVWVRRRNK